MKKDNLFGLGWFDSWIFNRFLKLLAKRGFVEMDLSENPNGFVDMVIFRHYSCLGVEDEQSDD